MKITDIIKLYKIYREVKKIMSEMKEKPGIKTTELLTTGATILSALWFAFSGMIPPVTAVVIVAVAGCVYTVCRTIVKLTPSKTDDELLEKLAEKFRKK